MEIHYMAETTWIFQPEKLNRKKYVEITWVFRPAKLHRKKYVETTCQIASIKVGGDKIDFLTSEITSKKKKCGNDVDFLISELHRKKYVEMSWKFVEICSSTYRRNIGVESTRIQRGVPVGITLPKKL